MTAPSAPRDYNRFAIVPVIADSTGLEVTPSNAIFVGSQSAVMERVLDSKARKTALSIINDAAHARETLHAIRKREDAVAEREQSVSEYEDSVRQTLLQDFVGKLDALAARMDSLEAERAKDPDDDELPLLPGSDDGHLQASISAPKAHDPDAPSEDQKAVEDT